MSTHKNLINAESVITDKEKKINELLKNCSEKTKKALLKYKTTGDVISLHQIIFGIIEKHLEKDQQEILHKGNDDTSIADDLGIDSIVMMEIIMNIEEVLDMTIPNEELMDLRTLGDLKYYVECKSKKLKIPSRQQFEQDEIVKILPHADPFLFIHRAEIYGNNCIGVYKISGDEAFLKGHFKKEPIFPASIMLESLGQLAVLMLIKSKDIHGSNKINRDRILFTGCDGVRCTKLCKPNNILKLKVKLLKIRHPLAFFEGKITMYGKNNSKVIVVKKISLAFDYINIKK